MTRFSIEILVFIVFLQCAACTLHHKMIPVDGAARPLPTIALGCAIRGCKLDEPNVNELKVLMFAGDCEGMDITVDPRKHSGTDFAPREVHGAQLDGDVYRMTEPKASFVFDFEKDEPPPTIKASVIRNREANSSVSCTLEVVQYAGKDEINRTDSCIVITEESSGNCKGDTDCVRVGKNRDEPEVVLLLNGHHLIGPLNCELKYKPRRSSSQNIEIGNIESGDARCAGEVVVFSPGDGIHIEECAKWTSIAGESISINLPAPVKVGVKCWVLSSDRRALRRASFDALRAMQLYDTMGCGISIVPEFCDVSSACALRGANCDQCRELAESIHYEQSMIHVFYTDNGSTGGKCICRSNIAYVGRQADNETLAHELGHIFGFPGHTGCLYCDTNIMNGGARGRDHFTEGQCFRFNVSSDSFLQRRGLSRLFERSCSEEACNGCPPEELEVR